jgi:hypothetical protein
LPHVLLCNEKNRPFHVFYVAAKGNTWYLKTSHRMGLSNENFGL